MVKPARTSFASRVGLFILACMAITWTPARHREYHRVAWQRCRSSYWPVLYVLSGVSGLAMFLSGLYGIYVAIWGVDVVDANDGTP